MLKPFPIITTMYPPTPTPSPVCVCTSACLQHCSILVLQRTEEEERWGGGRGTDAILIIGQGLHWTGVCVHWDAGCRMQSASRGGFGQCLPGKGGVAAAHHQKKCPLLCHGRRLLATLPCYTTWSYTELHCRDELGTDHRHTAPLLTTDGKSAKTVFPQKHTATKWAQPCLPYVCVRTTWQYRHRTGKDIKHVLYVLAMP